MGKKINVVSLSHINDVEESSNEPSNDEQQLNEIKEEIKKEEEVKPIEVVEEVKPKPKRQTTQAKSELLSSNKVRAKPPTKKPKVIEEVYEPVVETVVEQPVKEEAPEKKVKTLELVKCEKCGKEMTKRTLRYDHPKTCPGEKIEREKIPVKRRAPIKKETVVEKPAQPVPLNVPEEIIEQEVKKRIQNTIQDRMQQRLKLKEEKIKKLATQIA